MIASTMRTGVLKRNTVKYTAAIAKIITTVSAVTTIIAVSFPPNKP